MENEIQKVPDAPKQKEIQELINHLILGMTMWISASVTCITTLLTVHQPWCLIALLLPFVYTMFPQIQKYTASMSEHSYKKFLAKKENEDRKRAEKTASKVIEKVIEQSHVQEQHEQEQEEREHEQITVVA